MKTTEKTIETRYTIEIRTKHDKKSDWSLHGKEYSDLEEARKDIDCVKQLLGRYRDFRIASIQIITIRKYLGGIRKPRGAKQSEQNS
jgi:hypothetical protein